MNRAGTPPAAADVRGFGAGGLGLWSEAPGRAPRCHARADRPLLLVRRTSDGYREERFALDTLSRDTGGARGSAEVRDESGAVWSVDLVLAPQGAGYAGELRYTLQGGAARGVFLGFTLDLVADARDVYVLLPGSVYDGNDSNLYIKDIPRVSRSGLLAVPSTSLASPCAAFHTRSAGGSVVIATAQRAGGLDTGFQYDARGPEPRVSVTAPFVRSEWYHLQEHRGEFRFHLVPRLEAGADLVVGESVTLPLLLEAAPDTELASMFRRVHALRPWFRGGHRRAQVLPLSAGAGLVEENLNRYHWRGEGWYANAVQADGSMESPQLLTGWCSGIITAYALLGVGSRDTRARAAAMIDFICDTGLSPSGLFYGAHQGGRWLTEQYTDPGPDVCPWNHVRMSEDATFYLLRAYELERRRGTTREGWLRAAAGNLDVFTRLWAESGEFGHFLDLESGCVLRGGSAAGALCIACLALGSGMTGERRYLDTARVAADSYYSRFTATGHTTGGPLDVNMAADSESCLMFPEAFMAVYSATGDPKYLEYATEAADQLASWVLSFDGVFPTGSTLDRRGVQTIGGIIASAQNHHIGPGGATSSLSSLLALYGATGEERFLRLLEDCATGLTQYLSREDGELDRLSRGMMSEQINLADAMNHAQGEIWNISASWGATNVLLTRLELPGVYLDPARRRHAVFDHVDVDVGWGTHRVRLTNTTRYTAETSVQIEGAARRPVILAPGDRLILKLEELDADHRAR